MDSPGAGSSSSPSSLNVSNLSTKKSESAVFSEYMRRSKALTAEVYRNRDLKATHRDSLLKGIDDLFFMFIDYAHEYHQMKGENIILKDCVPKCGAPASVRTSARNIPEEEKEFHAISIEPINEQSDFNENVKAVKEEFKKQNVLVSVKSCTKTKGGGICLRLGDQVDKDKAKKVIKSSEALKGSFKVKTAVKRNPKLVLYGVQDDFESDDAFLYALAHQNDLTNCDQPEGLKVAGRFRGKRGSNWIVECSPKQFHELMEQKRVYIGFQRVPVREYVRVVVCWQCGKFGHYQRDCKSNPRCTRCSGSEHVSKDCKLKPSCFHCSDFARATGSKCSSDHCIGDSKCLILQKAKARIKLRTNYEDDL